MPANIIGRSRAGPLLPVSLFIQLSAESTDIGVGTPQYHRFVVPFDDIIFTIPATILGQEPAPYRLARLHLMFLKMMIAVYWVLSVLATGNLYAFYQVSSFRQSLAGI